MPHGRVQVTSLDEWMVLELTMEPGWRWSNDVQPIAGTASCQQRHLGVILAGHFHVETDAGAVDEFEAGDIYEIPPGHDAWVLGDAAVHMYEFTSGRQFALPDEDTGDRRVVTVLMTDIVDSTVHLARLGDRRWGELLIEHNARVRGELDRFRGREINTTGDGFVAVFDTAGRAVRAAREVVREVQELGIAVRAGVHTGEVEFVGTDVRGLAVHLVARVMGHGGPGEVLVTTTTAELATGPGLEFEPIGKVELKGIDGARELFRLAPVGQSAS